jgi:hypothetical protein
MPVDRDLRATSLYRAVKDFYSALHAAGQGMVTDASDPTVTADGTRFAFSGVVFAELDRAPSTRICDFRIGSREVVIQGRPRARTSGCRGGRRTDGLWHSYPIGGESAIHSSFCGMLRAAYARGQSWMV